MSEPNTPDELRTAMLRLAAIPFLDLQSTYRRCCEHQRRFYSGEESEAQMLRYLLFRAAEKGVIV